ncbi:MAG: transporter substrate-binding domain-containing protein [Granulosicoccus sp.]|nr:transporter substrate-binding domain-containing protein [Granulosicoccus sp.]
MDATSRERLIAELAPHGVLRAGINMSNFLLVNRTDEHGQPDGVSPAMARALASALDLQMTLIPYDGPGDVADAATRDEWDIANIALEEERARVICFSPAYCEIQATYLVPPGSTLTVPEQVDKPGIRIAVKARSAYDLWLTRNLQHATLYRAATLDESFERFRDEHLDVLAGLRPKLLEQQAQMPGAVLFDDSFTSVQQCIGCPIDKPLAASYLADFVRQARTSGLVESLISSYEVQGRLSVAQ